jgi:AraC-like DNA-binding protein
MPMPGLVTVSNALVSAILDGAPLEPARREALIDEVGLVRERVRDVNERTSILELHRLWSRILELTGDDFVGLRIGEVVPGERFGLAVHAAAHSDDFRQMLLRFCKYAGLINALIRCTLEESPEAASLTMRFYFDVLDLERHAVDITFVAFVAWARRHLGEAFVLREVRFKHAHHAAQARCDALFGVPVTLGASRNEVIFDPAALDRSIVGSNQELGSILEKHAARELDEMPAVADLPSRVSQILRRELLEGRSVELPFVATELRMPPRHLQRRLKESFTSFSLLLDDARRGLAPRLLVEPAANVEQVGYRLGYSEPTAFIRAFKKWYGITPGDWRKRQ